MTKSESYIVNSEMNKVYDLIRSAINKKRYNIIGGISENGGLDLTPNLVFGNLDPNSGNMARINLSAVNISSDKQLCRLELKRINGLTFKIHVGGAIGFVILSLIIIGMYSLSSSKEFQWEILFMPLFGLFYLLILQGLVSNSISNTKNKILKILSDNKINYEKQ